MTKQTIFTPKVIFFFLSFIQLNYGTCHLYDKFISDSDAPFTLEQIFYCISPMFECKKVMSYMV